jgi:hypothetical protein
LHGEGKRWYQNERNYSREIFSSDETQSFMRDFFSRQVEERRKRNTELLALSKTAEWLLTREKTRDILQRKSPPLGGAHRGRLRYSEDG